jgi:hypothetical protein
MKAAAGEALCAGPADGKKSLSILNEGGAFETFRARRFFCAGFVDSPQSGLDCVGWGGYLTARFSLHPDAIARNPCRAHWRAWAVSPCASIPGQTFSAKAK